MKSEKNQKVQGAVMVVGGGIAGMQSALDLADAGFYVHLVENHRPSVALWPSWTRRFPPMTAPCELFLRNWSRSAGTPILNFTPVQTWMKWMEKKETSK